MPKIDARPSSRPVLDLLGYLDQTPGRYRTIMTLPVDLMTLDDLVTSGVVEWVEDPLPGHGIGPRYRRVGSVESA